MGRSGYLLTYSWLPTDIQHSCLPVLSLSPFKKTIPSLTRVVDVRRNLKREVQTGFKENKELSREDNRAAEQVAQRGCADSIPENWEDPTG